MFPWERYVWERKASAHVWRIRHLNNCMEFRQQRSRGDLADRIYQELALARAWRVFWRPVLP